jgi:hypothetical protein
MNTLNTIEIMNELEESKNTLAEKNVNVKNFFSFCYPSGIYNKEIVEIVEKTGYNLAVTTKQGWNNTTANLYTLRRIGLHQDMSSTKPMFACRIAGIF